MYKIIARTLFYHWLILSAGISIGFIANAEWLGYKSVLIEKSINNIFFPIEFTPQVEAEIKKLGAAKVFAGLGFPKDFEILGEIIYYNDEFYWCKYKCRDKNNKLKFGESTTRVKWKTWEYDYASDKDMIDTQAKAEEVVAKFNKWSSKIRNEIKKADSAEKAMREKEETINKYHE